MVQVMTSWAQEERVFKLFHAGLLALSLLLLSFAILQSPDDYVTYIPAALLLLGLAAFRHGVISRLRPNLLQLLFPLLEGAVVLRIIQFGAGSFGLSLLTVLIWDVALDYRTPYGIVYAVLGAAAYLWMYIAIGYTDLPLLAIVNLVTIGLFQIGIFLGFAFIAKSYYHQSKQLQALTAELHAKMIAMEEMTLVKERNRMAVEMHNTVGHQLTTALVQIEAAKLVQDESSVNERLDVIKTQVREGLQQVRQAIHAVDSNHAYEDLNASLQHLFGQAQDRAGLDIQSSIEDVSSARLSVKRVVYHSALEALTNGLRHGQCKRVRVSLRQQDGWITFRVLNDGRKPEKLTYGYGLKKMTDDVKELGGALRFQVDEQDWFGFAIEIPM